MTPIDDVYAERNRLVAALSKLFPSHLAKHPEDDASWDPEWRNIVCIHGPQPCGQLTWHIHDRELPWLTHLQQHPNDWDGHSSAEKYDRLMSLPIYSSFVKFGDCDVGPIWHITKVDP